MRLIVDALTDAQRDNLSLVLSAVGIEHETLIADDGWELWVEAHQQLAALRALDNYLDENQQERPENRAQFLYGWSRSAIFVVSLLSLFHAALLLTGTHDLAVKSWGASAQSILAGQIDRALTALFLHGDLPHLLGNIVGLMLFGGAVALNWGAAHGWLWIVLSASLGNLINALLYQTGHLSIGASTAVFSAIGLLAVRAFYLSYNDRRSRMRAWLPLAAGLALFAMLGSSTKTDVTAHLFGLISGMALGWLVRRGAAQIPSLKRRRIATLLLGLWVVGCWGSALLRTANNPNFHPPARQDRRCTYRQAPSQGS